MASDSDESGPEIPIVCEECDTETRIPLADVEQTLDQHNERLHDGEEKATVDPELAEHLADIVAEDLDLV